MKMIRLKTFLSFIFLGMVACTFKGQISPVIDPATLGNQSFAISGVTGGSDTLNDWNLNTTNIATISWQSYGQASSYDVAIYDSVGSVLVCPLQNTVSTSFTFSGCTLTSGQTYSLAVWAKNSSSITGTAATNNFVTFKVNQTPTISNSTMTLMYNGAQATGNPISAGSGTDPDGDTITINSVSSASKGTPVIIDSTTIGYTPSGTSYGADSFTVTYTDGYGASVTSTVNVRLMTAYTWMGLVGSNWNGASNNFCGSVTSPGFSGVCAGGGRPTSASTPTEIAVFNSFCSSNCSPTITTAQVMYGLDVDSSYTGTITQGTTNTITIGPGGFYLRGGNFVGGSGNITVGTAGVACDNTNMAMSVTTTGSFTSTSGILRINMGDFTMTPGTFNHNNGTVNMHAQFTGGSSQSLIVGNNHFYDFGLIGSQFPVAMHSGNLYVDRNLSINRTGSTSNRGLIYGNIFVGGNLSLTSCTEPTLSLYTADSTYTLTGTNSTVTGGFSGSDALCSIGNLVSNLSGTLNLSGIVRVRGDYKINSGSVSAAGSTLQLAASTTDTAVATIIPGGSTYGNVQFIGNAGNYDLSSSTMVIGGDLTLGDLYDNSNANINNGTFSVAGNLNVVNEGYLFGNYSVVLNGVNQTITGAAGASLGSITINSSGTLTLSGQIEIVRDFIVNTNSISAAGSTLVFDQKWNLNPSPILQTGTGNYGNVTFPDTSSVNYVFAGTNWNILGDLSVLNVTGSSNIASTDIKLYGNLIVTGNGIVGNAGSSLAIIGAGRTISQSAGAQIPFRNIFIGDGSTVTSVTSSTISLYTNAQTLTLTGSSTLNMGGNNLTVSNSSGVDNVLTLNLGSTLNMGGGTLTYESLVNNGTLNP